jgi:hypothetical protein
MLGAPSVWPGAAARRHPQPTRCLTDRGLRKRIELQTVPILSLVPDARAPPNGCWPTTAPVGLLVDGQVAGRVAQRLVRLDDRPIVGAETAPVRPYGVESSTSCNVASHSVLSLRVGPQLRLLGFDSRRSPRLS